MQLRVLIIIIVSVCVTSAFALSCEELFESLIVHISEAKKNEAAIKKVADKEIKKLVFSKKLNMKDIHKLDMDQKKSLLAIYGVAIVPGAEKFAFKATKKKLKKSNKIDIRILDLFKKNNISLEDSLDLVGSSDAGLKQETIVTLQNNLLNQTKNAPEQKELHSSFLKFTTIGGNRFYDSKLWSLMALDMTDPAAAALKVIFEGAMDSKFVGKSMKKNIELLKDQIRLQIDKGIDKLPLSRNQKDFLRRYIGSAISIEAICEGGNYIDTLKKASKDFNGYIKNKKDPMALVEDIKEYSKITLDDMRINIIEIKNNVGQAHANIVGRVSTSMDAFSNGPTANDCLMITNKEVGEYLKGAGEFMNSMGEDLRTIFGKHIYDLAKAFNSKFDKNDCNKFAVEQSKKVIEFATKLMLANLAS